MLTDSIVRFKKKEFYIVYLVRNSSTEDKTV